jgi:hypothetical protein
MKRVIFSLYIDIPKSKLDNPGSWDNKTNTQYKTDKSHRTKEKFLIFKDRLIARQRKYAEICGVDYLHFDSKKAYKKFASWFTTNAPQISEYDIINFYKHYLMRELADTYDEVCYFDLDVVPQTEENLFEVFDLSKFHVGNSNLESQWGRNVSLEFYNACIRNPASKYYNAKAMAEDADLEPCEDVFNTGIMIANSDVIKQLDYFDDMGFALDILSMVYVKEDEESMYPWPIRRSFGYDNETLFSHRLNKNEVPYALLPDEWHCTTDKGLETAKLCHVISKNFELYV